MASTMEDVSRRAAMEIFPPELWVNILGNLDKGQDILNCSNANPLFRDILNRKLLPQVLEVVQRHLAKTKFKLTELDILKCRLVSKDWKNMTDQYLQSRASRLDLACYQPTPLGHQHSFSDQHLMAPNYFGCICLRMAEMEQAELLVASITCNAKVKKGENALVGRNLVVVGNRNSFYGSEDPRDTEKLDFYDLVTRLLTDCGQHIWYLSVCDFIYDGLPFLFLQTYWKWLRLVPHLKVLTCQVDLCEMDNDTQLETKGELEECIVHVPFPRLPELVTLQCNGVPDVLIDSALEVNPQIKNLEVVPFRYEVERPLRIHEWGNTSLREFCFIRCKAAELRQITETGWPLEKLSLRFELELGPQQWNTEYCLEQLGNFGKTLKYLRMEFPNRFADLKEPPWELRLPYLEMLQVDVRYHARLDYILPCQRLKKLKLSLEYYEEGVVPHIVLRQTTSSMRNLFQSNIWQLMPALKEVEIEMYKYDAKRFANLKYTRNASTGAV